MACLILNILATINLVFRPNHLQSKSSQQKPNCPLANIYASPQCLTIISFTFYIYISLQKIGFHYSVFKQNLLFLTHIFSLFHPLSYSLPCTLPPTFMSQMSHDPQHHLFPSCLPSFLISPHSHNPLLTYMQTLKVLSAYERK